MPCAFSVITDTKKIANLNRILGEKLSKTYLRIENRTIASPAGNFLADVHFEHNNINSEKAWSAYTSKNNLRLINLLLIGKHNSTTDMNIFVQLNFPATKYNRQVGGAFIEDAEGKVLIAHRGRLAKGRGALKQNDVFAEFLDDLIEAKDDDTTSKVILIASLDSPDIADRLWKFANKARDVATRLGAARSP